MIDGEPLQLIRHEKNWCWKCAPSRSNCSRSIFKLRAQGVFSIRDVKSAILGTNGQLILQKAGEENQKYPLITDGVIQQNIL